MHALSLAKDAATRSGMFRTESLIALNQLEFDLHAEFDDLIGR